MLNEVNLIGNLGRDPEIRQTGWHGFNGELKNLTPVVKARVQSNHQTTRVMKILVPLLILTMQSHFKPNKGINNA